MSPLAPVYFGSVNRWECDENDHLNVRFYAQKMQQTLTLWIVGTSVWRHPLTLDTTLQSIAAQHMRYLAEARIATPLTGLIGLLGTTENSFTVLTELHNTETGLVQASFTQTFNTRLERHPASHVPLPDHAGSRGIAYRDSPFAHLSLAEALEQGFITIRQGYDSSRRMLSGWPPPTSPVHGPRFRLNAEPLGPGSPARKNRACAARATRAARCSNTV